MIERVYTGVSKIYSITLFYEIWRSLLKYIII